MMNYNEFGCFFFIFIRKSTTAKVRKQSIIFDFCRLTSSAKNSARNTKYENERNYKQNLLIMVVRILNVE